MNPQNENNQPQIHNPLSVMQPGEQVLCEIRRHPIGMIAQYILVGFILFITAVLAFAIGPQVLSSTFDHQQITNIGMLLFVVLAIFSGLYLVAQHYIYSGNRWVVTSDSITQVVQTGIFTKQASQLSMGNLEDVTVEQNGLLTQMFNYGVIKAETAGERSKFTFLYCPSPNTYAKQILDAREEFELVHHGGKQPPQPFREEYQPPTEPTPQPPTSNPAQPGY
jgi:membrane protein YdbS with pleckstrin-like domain